MSKTFAVSRYRRRVEQQRADRHPAGLEVALSCARRARTSFARPSASIRDQAALGVARCSSNGSWRRYPDRDYTRAERPDGWPPAAQARCSSTLRRRTRRRASAAGGRHVGPDDGSSRSLQGAAGGSTWRARAARAARSIRRTAPSTDAVSAAASARRARCEPFCIELNQTCRSSPASRCSPRITAIRSISSCIDGALTENTRTSKVLGADSPVRQLRRLAHRRGAVSALVRA